MGKNALTDFPQAIEEEDYSAGLGYGVARLPRLSENGSGCLFPAFWVVSKVQELGVHPDYVWNGLVYQY